MSEQELLHQILSGAVIVDNVRAWLDISYTDGSQRDMNDCKIFERHEPLRFVVALLNFIREDATPLLSPGDRLNGVDNVSSTPAIKERASGQVHAQNSQSFGESWAEAYTNGEHTLWLLDREYFIGFSRQIYAVASSDNSCTWDQIIFGFDTRKLQMKGALAPNEKRQTKSSDLSSRTQFDISSTEEFPTLARVQVSRLGREASKQKRRIRPTPLSSSDKPLEGDITIIGADDTRVLGTMDDIPTRHCPISYKPSRHWDFSGQLPGATPLSSERIPYDTWSNPTDAQGLRSALAYSPTRDCTMDSPVTLQEYGGESCATTDLREAASGSLPLTSARHASGSDLVQLKEDVTEVKPAVHADTCTGDFTVTISESRSPDASSVDAPKTPQRVSSCSHSAGPASAWVGADPLKLHAATSRVLPTSGMNKRIRWVEAPALARLASLYVHVILRRLVPNLATEIHLAVRLLHVHPNTTRSFSTELSSSVQACEQVSPIQGSRTHPPMADGQNNTSTNGISSIRSVFTSGLDCRAFAAHVFLGLESLLPHVGVDTLETLARTSALDSESEVLVSEVRRTLIKARGESGAAIVRQGSSVGQQCADDTAIVQNVGAPFAALQWQEVGCIKSCRTNAERALYQNRQETVDRFGTLLRDFQASKKGLQRYPERALQTLRTGSLGLLDALAPANLQWLAGYFLAQLVGWGISAPEETDSEVVALVAPAGDRGRATLQKLHRRISTPRFGEDETFSKSSQKLRHPCFHQCLADIDGNNGESPDLDSVDVFRSGGWKTRASKPGVASKQSKGQGTLGAMRIPMAPLQLRWFPGNQEFFYHVLLALDSYMFNSHLKHAIAAEIAKLYYKPSQYSRKALSTQDMEVNNAHTKILDGKRTGDGVDGFTERSVKLKVLAKFLGLLTFAPNWGVGAGSTSGGMLLPTDAQERRACQPLPLEQYLAHALSSKGLVGAVPWISDFLRMMKWDVLSIQMGPYQDVLETLGNLHAQPCMQPGHPRFSQALLAVSCEIETLFEDLGLDLGVHGFRASLHAKVPVAFGTTASSMPVVRSPKSACGIASNLDDTWPSFGSAGKAGSERKCGSLDSDVVLSRRLIQNCCPYLEDVLALIGTLDRTWNLGLGHGSEPSASRVNRSPHIPRGTGVSPRSRRIIKPHPLRPLPTMPSVPERQSTNGTSAHTGNDETSLDVDCARLRLVEAFFHTQPSELQITADFVVRRAVQNSCEDVLSDVIRPALASSIHRSHEITTKTTNEGSPTNCRGESSSSLVSGMGGIVSKDHMSLSTTTFEECVTWTKWAFERTVGFKARSLAGETSRRLAEICTLSLVPQCLPPRVRGTAAAIAGHHADSAAQKKMGDLTASAVSEAAFADLQTEEEYHDARAGASKSHLDVEETTSLEGQAAKELSQYAKTSFDNRVAQHQSYSIPSSYSGSNVPKMLSALNGVAEQLGIDPGIERDLIEAALVFVNDNDNKIGPAKRVFHGTICVLLQFSQQFSTRAYLAPASCCSAAEGSDPLHNNCAGTVLGAQVWVRKRGSLEYFLSLLTGIWRNLDSSAPVRNFCLESLHSDVLTGDLVTAFECAVDLAAFMVQGEGSIVDGVVHGVDSPGRCTAQCARIGRYHATSIRSDDFQPWTPAVELILLGAIPVVKAENVLLSRIEALSSRQEQLSPRSCREDCGLEEIIERSRNAMRSVATAVVRDYHARGIRKDLSRVLLMDLLDYTAESLSAMPRETMQPCSYHPMGFCRLVGRLTRIERQD